MLAQASYPAGQSRLATCQFAGPTNGGLSAALPNLLQARPRLELTGSACFSLATPPLRQGLLHATGKPGNPVASHFPTWRHHDNQGNAASESVGYLAGNPPCRQKQPVIYQLVQQRPYPARTARQADSRAGSGIISVEHGLIVDSSRLGHLSLPGTSPCNNDSRWSEFHLRTCPMITHGDRKTQSKRLHLEDLELTEPVAKGLP